MPIDPATLESGTPQTTDGRSYPPHLREYETYDEALLPLLDSGELTFDELVARVQDPRAQSVAPHWLASATWRGLIERRSPHERRPRAYALTERGRAHLVTALS